MVYVGIFLSYIFGCMLAGHFGRKRRIGYWGWLFLSILITPPLAWLILFLSSPKPKPEARPASG